MFSTHHQFLIEISKRHALTPLGRVQASMDWVPVQEALAFDRLCRNGTSSGSANFDVRIEPEWATPGQPQIRGIHATPLHGNVPGVSRRFPLTLFAANARRAADQFVESGALNPGDLFEYCVLALPLESPPAAPIPSASRRFVVENGDIPIALKPADFTTFIDAALTLGTGDAEDFPVFVHWRVLQEISALTRRAGGLETGGILVGHLCRDASKVFLEITAQIPSPVQGELTRLAFTPAGWSRMQAAADIRGKAAWVGWWHCHSWTRASAAQQASLDQETLTAHPSSRAFFSEDDCLVHRTVFSRAQNVALLVTDSPHHGMTWTAFGWRDAQITARKFHVLDLPLFDDSVLPIQGADHAATGHHTRAH